MSAMSDALEQDFIKYYFTAESIITRPTAWYLHLHTGSPSEAGTSNGLTIGADNYAREAVTFVAPTGGVTSNSADVVFNTPSASWGTITHWSVWTASSAGTCLATGAFSTPSSFTVSANVVLTIPAGACQLTAL